MFCMAHELFYLGLSALFLLAAGVNGAPAFDVNYKPQWGNVTVLDQGNQVRISMNEHSGGGITSKEPYMSGRIGIRLKAPKVPSKGAITAFYLTSDYNHYGPPNRNVNRAPHDEIDFEFLGNETQTTLSTNIFVQDDGFREQQFKLWFDPAADFHYYEFLWNTKQIVFSVDGQPIRVYKHTRETKYPVTPLYPSGSVWNWTQWVGPVDWSQGPFEAYYTGFEINGCPFKKFALGRCYSEDYEWNKPNNWQLNPEQLKTMNDIRSKYMIYDYCQTPRRQRECDQP